jgi:RNA polymerase sigma-70 factor (ECF subfamily)
MSEDGGADGFDDAYLVQRAQEGYLDAYAELVNRHSLLAYRVALRILGHHHDAEDVAQESLVTAWQQLPQFRGDSSFSTWLYRIVTRKALNRINRERRHSAAEVLEELADDSPQTDVAVERNETVDAITDAIQALPPAQRVVVVLHHLEGLSYADVAVITASSVPAVRSQLYRARRALGSALAEWR